MGGNLPLNHDEGTSIAVDATGNVFTTGYFFSTSDFDPGTGTFNLTSLGLDDIFVSKLDALGNFVWTKQWGGTSAENSYSIAVDASGNVLTTGSFQSSTVDFDPGPGTFNLTSTGNRDIFVSKLDASGNFVWATSMGGGGTSVDGSGNGKNETFIIQYIDILPGLPHECVQLS